MPKVLYISYWGALEQLGQSLVIPAVKKLAQMGTEITLVTFEKPNDLQRANEMERVGKMLSEDGIEWLPLKYHKDPKIPATLFDIAQGIVRGLQKRLTKKFDIVHARSFPAGLVGLVLAPLIGAKLIYHNEGFYPDEQVDSGVWAKDSRPHRITKRLENLMYSRADGIIALSFRSKEILEILPAIRDKRTPIIVVPSCVDLHRFQLKKAPTYSPNNEIIFVYLGSIGGRYALDEVARFISVAKNIDSRVRLRIYSKGNKVFIKNVMSNNGLSDEEWTLEAINYSEVPEHLSKCTVGIHFLRKGISEHSGSPTKIGEYWATGLPVVITSNMSDNDNIVEKENIGVVINSHSDESYSEAFKRLNSIILDQNIMKRCRNAAERYYGLEPACLSQFELYQKVVGKSF